MGRKEGGRQQLIVIIRGNLIFGGGAKVLAERKKIELPTWQLGQIAKQQCGLPELAMRGNR